VREQVEWRLIDKSDQIINKRRTRPFVGERKLRTIFLNLGLMKMAKKALEQAANENHLAGEP
jgi:hypothetical protein